MCGTGQVDFPVRYIEIKPLFATTIGVGSKSGFGITVLHSTCKGPKSQTLSMSVPLEDRS